MRRDNYREGKTRLGKVITATGDPLPNNVSPNTNFSNLKEQKGTIQDNLELKNEAKIEITVPSHLDGIPPKRIVVPALSANNNNIPTTSQ